MRLQILLNIKCELTLICSVSLKDVKMPVDIDVNEYISQMDENIEENNKIINNTIDLIPIIWQNIILEVPLKVISDEASRENLSGDGWRLITDEKDLKETVASAIQQINDMDYASGLTEKGIPMERIKKYGFAFEGKKVLIGC